MKLKIPPGIHELLSEAALAAPVRIELPSEERRDFVIRYMQAARNESALLSLDSPESPSFAIGDYPNICFKTDGNFVIVTKEPEPQLTSFITVLAGSLGVIDSYEVPSSFSIASFRSGLANSKKKLMKLLDNPEHIELVYVTTPYIEGRTVRFFRPSRDGLDFSPIFPNEPVDSSNETI